MSITYPYLPTLFNFLHNEFFFLLANAEKLNLFPSKKSYFFLVAKKEAMILPALLPATIFGMQSVSSKV
jgi:hypothetical protein